MQSSTKSNLVPIIILGVLFFVFGFVTWLNGTLIPYLKIACELTTFQALQVAFAFYISYFVTALPASWILNKTGFKKGIMLGLLVMAAGALMFIPAAQSRTYAMFLTGLFIIGTGLSLLQTAVNPYITIVGPIESAAQRISIMGICNKVAGFIAPFILGAVILSDADSLTKELLTLDAVQKAARLDELALRVVTPYTLMALVLVGLALMVRFSPLPEIEQEQDEDPAHPIAGSEKTSVAQYPNLVLGVITLFFYVGLEVVAGDTIGTYGQSQGIPLSEARFFTSFTMGAMVLGYIIGIIVIPRYITQAKALTYSAIVGIALSVMVMLTSGYVSVLFVAMLGLANALVWPAIWPLAIHGLGRFTKTASALLIMAILGGALMPLVYGSLADMESIGPKMAYIILIPSYLIILYYALKGHKKTSW
jgi:MFS transporter, FHS family, L-fucose permease